VLLSRLLTGIAPVLGPLIALHGRRRRRPRLGVLVLPVLPAHRSGQDQAAVVRRRLRRRARHCCRRRPRLGVLVLPVLPAQRSGQDQAAVVRRRLRRRNKRMVVYHGK